MPRPKKVYGAALDELLVRIIETQSKGIAHFSEQRMSEHNPRDEQKLGEAITAMNSAFRVYVRALLVAIAALLKVPAPELSEALSHAIDGMFISYRNVMHESLKLNRSVVVETQNIVGRLEDRVIALEALHKDELAAVGLNSIEAGKP